MSNHGRAITTEDFQLWGVCVVIMNVALTSQKLRVKRGADAQHLCQISCNTRNHNEHITNEPTNTRPTTTRTRHVLNWCNTPGVFKNVYGWKRQRPYWLTQTQSVTFQRRSHKFVLGYKIFWRGIKLNTHVQLPFTPRRYAPVTFTSRTVHRHVSFANSSVGKDHL